MKRGLSVFLSAIVPMVALVTTSCDKVKKLNYSDALLYASDHFDNNSLDAVMVDYTANINKIGADINVNIIDDIGVVSDVHFAAGIGNISAVARGFYGYCMSSMVINQVQNNYATISSLVMESFTKIPVDLSYEIVNGGGMKITLGTGNLSNNVVDLVRLAVSFVTALSYVPEDARLNIIEQLFGKGASKSEEEIPDYPEKKKEYSVVTDGEIIAKRKKKKMGKGLAGIVFYITQLMNDGLGISVDPTSSSMNDSFNAYIGCESHGYITSAGVKLGGDVNIGLLVATTDEFDIENPELTGLGGRYTFTGNIGIDLSVTAEFTK